MFRSVQTLVLNGITDSVWRPLRAQIWRDSKPKAGAQVPLHIHNPWHTMEYFTGTRMTTQVWARSMRVTGRMDSVYEIKAHLNDQIEAGAPVQAPASPVSAGASCYEELTGTHADSYRTVSANTVGKVWLRLSYAVHYSVSDQVNDQVLRHLRRAVLNR